MPEPARRLEGGPHVGQQRVTIFDLIEGLDHQRGVEALLRQRRMIGRARAPSRRCAIPRAAPVAGWPRSSAAGCPRRTPRRLGPTRLASLTVNHPPPAPRSATTDPSPIPSASMINSGRCQASRSGPSSLPRSCGWKSRPWPRCCEGWAGACRTGRGSGSGGASGCGGARARRRRQALRTHRPRGRRLARLRRLCLHDDARRQEHPGDGRDRPPRAWWVQPCVAATGPRAASRRSAASRDESSRWCPTAA